MRPPDTGIRREVALIFLSRPRRMSGGASTGLVYPEDLKRPSRAGRRDASIDAMTDT